MNIVKRMGVVILGTIAGIVGGVALAALLLYFEQRSEGE